MISAFGMCTQAKSIRLKLREIRVQGTESTLPLKFNFVNAQYCPTSSTRFCIQYQKSLQVYEMVPSFEKEEESLSKNIKLELVG